MFQLYFKVIGRIINLLFMDIRSCRSVKKFSKLLKRKYFKQVSRLFHGSIIGVGASKNIAGSFNGGLRIF